ncbi:hypothetical protein ENKNEFLB_01969 [Nocardioides aquaticus]|uniref:Transmembrane protein n=1 Tax=Nocardioides aquaticus TaxID=160826 RepID=A0ABX8EGZ8_9ACTN|nr:hypothetical protein [Nocardioides aquaticus]QVT79586.1 hypothetical protein ENKNEFLB_01969 [Nocardioides aquaticus]
MGSNEVADQLREVERAEAAPYVDLLPSPWWYPPVVGAWAASLAAVLLLDLSGVALLALVALELAFIGWMVRRQGAWPRMTGSKPPEVDRAYWQFLGGLAVLAVAVGLAGWLAGPVTVCVVVLVGVTAGLWLYERAYERAVARVRARLALA